jgi:hypothetical protein
MIVDYSHHFNFRVAAGLLKPKANRAKSSFDRTVRCPKSRSIIVTRQLAQKTDTRFGPASIIVGDLLSETQSSYRWSLISSLVERRPTPEELLNAILNIVPEFGSNWESPDNYFRSDDGTFTLNGVFAEFSHYVRDAFSNLGESQRLSLFELVEKCVRTDPNSDSGVSNAACPCFLENLAGEGRLSQPIAPYLGPKSKLYFDDWN